MVECRRMAEHPVHAGLAPISSDKILATTVVAGRPWNRGRVIRMEAEAGIGGQGDCRPSDSSLRGQGLLGCCCFAAPVKLKTERSAERGKRPFGGIGFRSLKGNVMHLAGGGAVTFPGAMAFSNDGCSLGLYREADPRNVDGEECALVFARQHATGFRRLPAPAVKAEDPVGLRDGVPAFEIGQLPPVRLTRPDMARDWVGGAAPAAVLLRSPLPYPHA